MAEIKEKYPNKTIWLYTGDLWENVRNDAAVQYIDVLVDGEFIPRSPSPFNISSFVIL